MEALRFMVTPRGVSLGFEVSSTRVEVLYALPLVVNDKCCSCKPGRLVAVKCILLSFETSWIMNQFVQKCNSSSTDVGNTNYLICLLSCLVGSMGLPWGKFRSV